MTSDEFIESVRVLIEGGHPLSGAAARQLLAEVDCLKRDAARWRFIRDSPQHLMTWRGDFYARDSADLEVDIAMRIYAEANQVKRT